MGQCPVASGRRSSFIHEGGKIGGFLWCLRLFPEVGNSCSAKTMNEEWYRAREREGGREKKREREKGEVVEIDFDG